jgi:hypothetical protein
MLRNNIQINREPLPDAIETVPNVEVSMILAFLDQNLSSFPPYFAAIKDSDRENRISDFLVHHLQLRKVELNDGIYPFDFRKNPTQATSGKETDIGVFVLHRSLSPSPIIEFEAKRFSETSHNQQYVHGAGRGGIERFKRGEHSANLKQCGMFAYVQKSTTQEWIDRVNGWIADRAAKNVDKTIDWTGVDEPLIKIATYQKIEKLSSNHPRKQSGDSIFLWHYFIDLNN